MKYCWLLALQATICATILLCFTPITKGALFSVEVAEPALQFGDIGTLRVIYDGGLENYSFEQGGLDLKLTSSNPGVIKFLDAEILNDGRWEIANTFGITDDSIGRMFAASIFTPGLAGTGPRVFAEIKYTVAGSGGTDVLLDVAGEDPLVHGPLGDVSNSVFSRGACVGDCLPGSSPVEINLGESWARLKAEMYAQPVQHQPLPPIPPQPQPPNPVGNPPVVNEPVGPEGLSPEGPTVPGMFSLEIVEQALEFGDTGKLRVIYNGGTANHAFENGGIGLKLTSSNPGVIKFTDAEILNDDQRWLIAAARGIGDDAVAELFAMSLFTPGLAGTGPQIFAEIEYSLLGPGFTDLALDIQGEDPLVDNSVGDVSSGILSRGTCLGECLGSSPVEIDLGESWARLKAEIYAPPVFPQPPVAPPVVEPIIIDPMVVQPVVVEPVVVEPVVADPVVVDPVVVELVVGGPILGDPVVEVPGTTDPVWVGGWYNVPYIDDPSVIDYTDWWRSNELEIVRTDGLIQLIDYPNTVFLNYFSMCGDMSGGVYDNDATQLRAFHSLADITAMLGMNSVNPSVPEPGSAALVGFSIIGLILGRRQD